MSLFSFIESFHNSEALALHRSQVQSRNSPLFGKSNGFGLSKDTARSGCDTLSGVT